MAIAGNTGLGESIIFFLSLLPFEGQGVPTSVLLQCSLGW